MEKACRHRLAGLFHVLVQRILACLLVTIMVPSIDVTAGMLEPIDVRAEHQTVPDRTGLERSAFATEAAFVLRSRHPDFGGLSGIWLADDAERLIAVGDSGWVWQARLHHDTRGTLIDIDAWLGTKIRPESQGFRGSSAHDAEALAGDGEGGLMVAYEGHHAFNRLSFPDLSASPGHLPIPEGLGAPSNAGIEALVGLQEGVFLAMAEGVAAPDGIGLSAWLVNDQRARRLTYRPTPGFAPTGADRLGSTIYVIERQFSLLGGFRSQISRMSVGQLTSDTPINPETLVRFRYGDLGENFEAIAVRTAPDGRVLLYLLADDNFSPFQRTVLLQLSSPKTEKDVVVHDEAPSRASSITD